MREVADQYQELIGKFTVGIYIFHLPDEHDEQSFCLLSVNARTERETGVKCESIIGRTLDEVFPDFISTSYPMLLKQVVLNQKECNFGTILYGDQRIKMSRFKARAYPLPGRCLALLIENSDKLTKDEENRKDAEFTTLTETVESSIDSLIHDFHSKSAQGVLSHVLCHLVSFYSRQIGETVDKIEGKDVTLVLETLISSEKFQKKDSIEKILITYPYYTNTSTFLNILILRFINQTAYTSGSDAEKILLKIITILTVWIENHFYHFYQDEVLIVRIRAFIYYIVGNCKTESIKKKKYLLLTLLDEQLVKRQPTTLAMALRTVKSHLPYANVDILQYTPLELAHHLTLSFSERFYAIVPHELLKGAWVKKDKRSEAPNVFSLIQLSNRFSSWIISEIVVCRELERRVQMLKHFIEVGYEAMQYNDWQTMMTVGTSLQSISVSRLTDTWKNLDQKTTKLWNKLSPFTLPTKNFVHYREALTEVTEKSKTEPIPVLPYFALYSRDLDVIDEVNDTHDEDEKINFDKMDLLATPIMAILLFQKCQFHFTRNLELKAYLLHDILILDEDQQYEYSKACEVGGKAAARPDRKSLGEQAMNKLFKNLRKSGNGRSGSVTSELGFADIKPLKRKESREDFVPRFDQMIVRENKKKVPQELDKVDSLIDSLEEIIDNSDEAKKKDVRALVGERILKHKPVRKLSIDASASSYSAYTKH